MKRNLFLAITLIATLFLAPSCGKKGGSTGLLVPDDASIVVHVNNSSLASKLSWDEIKQSNWFKELTKRATDTMAQQLLADPGVTGVDPKSDFVFFIKKSGRSSYYVMQGSLKDVDMYSAYIKKVTKDAAQKKDGDITSTVIHESNVIAWDKSHFVAIGDMPLPDYSALSRRGSMGEMKINKLSADSLAYYGKQVLTMNNSSRLDNDERFAELVKDGKDIHFWMNTGMYYQGLMGPMMSMMGNMSALFDGNISASSFNFDNGKITMDSKQYYGKELSSVFAKYKGDNVSTELAGRIPAQNVMCALAINYPPEAIKEFLKVTRLDGLVNMGLAETNYSIDEFIKANKGEVLLAVSDFTVKQKRDTVKLDNGATYMNDHNSPDAKVLFATAVNDQPSFDKLVTLLWNQSKNSFGKPDITYRIENKWFAAGNDAEQVNQFLAGGTNNKAPYVEKISGHPIGFFFDIQKLIQVASMDTKDTAAKTALDVSLKTWQDITGYGGEYKNKALQFHAEVNMVDKNTNSLKQLNAYIDMIYQTMGSRINRHMDEMGIDSLKVKDVELKEIK